MTVRILDDDELAGALDWYRGIVLNKLDGLDRSAATRHVMQSGVTLLGVGKHLTWVEREWFEEHVAGQPADPWDVDESFDLDDDDTVAGISEAYRAACARSRDIVAERSLDDETLVPHHYFGIVTLRWVLYHMIRETARHCGHMDILREMTDGAIGD